MLKHCLIAFLFAVISVSGHAQTMSSMFTKAMSAATKEIDKGKKALDVNKLAKAKKHFNKAIKANENAFEAYGYLGIIADMEKDLPKAAKYFNDSLARFDKFKEHLLERKTDYLKDMERKSIAKQVDLDSHKLQGASGHTRTLSGAESGANAIQYSAGNPAQLESENQALKDRVKTLKEELEKDKQLVFPAFFYFKYGNVFMKTGKRDQAKAQYLKAIESDPDFKDVYPNISVVYFMEKDCRNAMEMYKKGKSMSAQFNPNFEKDLLANCK